MARRRIKAAAEGTTRLDPQPDTPWPTRRELVRIRSELVERLRPTFEALAQGHSAAITAAASVARDLLARLAGHPRHFGQLALLSPRRRDYLLDHALATGVLALAIGTRLGWSRGDLGELGLAALLCDAGMLAVPARVRTSRSVLTRLDQDRVGRHPVLGLALLAGLPGLSAAVQLATLQHHEREDGSGYPHGRRGNDISDLTRVLAVADTLAAALGPRSWRQPKAPFTAMHELIAAAREKKAFWPPAVRALVQAVGLFPAGSYVALSAGRHARVAAANPQHPHRPAVQLLDPQGQVDGPPLDLAALAPDQLSIVRGLSGPTG